MNKLQIKISKYLKEKFKYNSDKDIEAAKNILTYDRLSDEVFAYEQYKDLKMCIFENVNYDMLKQEFEYEGELYSLLELMYELDFITIDIKDMSGWREKLKKMFMSISKEEFLEIKKSGLNIDRLIGFLFFYVEGVKDIYDIVEFTYCDSYDGYEVDEGKLKDPLYEYPELGLINLMKCVFEFTNKDLVEVLDIEFYEYATYCVGSTNSDDRDEYMVYYRDFLRPYILKEDKKNNYPY